MSDSFSKILLDWYEYNQRNHPWKQEPDPYKIWLSEIIMQQTRVEQGTPYYLRFVEKYPTVEDLANSPLDEVLKLWEGLGYYSRARNLHQAAKEIVEKYNAVFPQSFDEIVALKGVGNYTASAIASFAFRLPYAVVDGNVSRVLSRIFGIMEPIDFPAGKKAIEKLAHNILDKKRPDLHNQAIMDFGALVCKPANPACNDCPFKIDCFAFKQEKVRELPFKKGKTQKKERKFNYLVLHDENDVLLSQRKGDDIWKGLFQFPELPEGTASVEEVRDYVSNKEMHLLQSKVIKNYRQTLSHRQVEADFYLCRVEKIYPLKIADSFISKRADLDSFAFPKIIRNFLKDNLFILFSILNFL